MYLGIDVGASKILFAVFEPDGKLVFEHKVATPQNYQRFLAAIRQAAQNDLSSYPFTWACCAVPGWIDHQTGVAVSLGNLPWQNVPIKSDLQELMPRTKLLVHNDAKLAGLSEAILIQEKYSKVLYLTISTGIGGGVIVDGLIDPEFTNFEPGQMVFDYQGRRQKWESFASGKALHNRYGKLAADIDDPAVWRDYANSLVAGFEDLLATVQPEAVVIGGGVGAHFEKFQPFLEQELKKINNPMVSTPPLLKARRPEEAVIYGCYEYIKQHV